jgi:hypothetical protein
MFLQQGPLIGIFAASSGGVPKVQLTGFFVNTTSGTINVNWGDGFSETLTLGVPMNHSFSCVPTKASEGLWRQVYPCIDKMETTSISITPQFGNNTVTVINCGTSTPKLSGTIDISAFPNLQEFRCNNNDITALSGYTQNSNLSVVEFFNNKVTGSIPGLSAMTNLVSFQCYRNQFTGSAPSLSGLTKLLVFSIAGNLLTGTFPSLSTNTALRDFYIDNNSFTGTMPNLSANTKLELYFGQDTLFTGPIADLSNNPDLVLFWSWRNEQSGTIPSLSANTKLQTFWCQDQKAATKITGFAGGSVSNTLGDFRAQNNQLTQSAVDAILAAFVAANRTTGTRTLLLAGTGNASPTGGQNNPNKLTLESRGWFVQVN